MPSPTARIPRRRTGATVDAPPDPAPRPYALKGLITDAPLGQPVRAGAARTIAHAGPEESSRMTIQHTVVFRLVHEAGSPAERDFLETGRRTLSAIPGVEGFTITSQVSAKSDMAWQFSMSFASRTEYDAYDAHPDHRRFVTERWEREVAASQEYDFVVHPG